jgi:hypothetical protein
LPADPLAPQEIGSLADRHGIRARLPARAPD